MTAARQVRPKRRWPIVVGIVVVAILLVLLGITLLGAFVGPVH
jgi:CHASE2 domain-containing sensor protein